MAPGKRGAMETYRPCPHLLHYKAHNGGAKCFRFLKNHTSNHFFPFLTKNNTSGQVMRCSTCNLASGRIYACVLCASISCWRPPSSPSDLPHVVLHAQAHLGHNLAIDLYRMELFCCICADQVYDADFDRAVISCSNKATPAYKGRPRKLANGKNVELSNGPETRSKRKREKIQCHPTHRQQVLISKRAAMPVQCELPWGLRGFNNLGNTCFMNCVLQVLLHMPPLKSYFLSDAGHHSTACKAKGSHLCLTCEMSTIYNAAFSRDHSPYSPAQFLYSWWQRAADLAGYKQQDAHEFFISLIDGFHANLAASTQTERSKSADDADCECIAHRVFSGLLRSDLMCAVCGYCSTTHDPCIDLSLDMEPTLAQSDAKLSNGHACRAPRGNQAAGGITTIYGCLDHFTRPEKMGADEKFHCEICKVPQRFVKQMSVQKLPPVLCLHIKRFEHSSASNVSRKVDRYVQFPFKLDMAPFLSASIVSARHGHRLVSRDGEQVDAILPAEFELLAVVTHSGKLDSGHYITHLRLGGLWYRCDDAWISKVSDEMVRSSQAYMLFYIQKSLLEQAT